MSEPETSLDKKESKRAIPQETENEDAATLNLAWNPSALPASQDGPGGCGHTHRLRSSVGCFKTNKVSYNRSGGQKHAMVSELFGVATYSEMLPPPPTSSSSSFLKTRNGDPETAGELSEVTKLPLVGPDKTLSPYSTSRNLFAAPSYSAT